MAQGIIYEEETIITEGFIEEDRVEISEE